MSDPFDLERFIRAQDPVFEQVRAELSRGRKVIHWMWFVFPSSVCLRSRDASSRRSSAIPTISSSSHR